MADEDIGDDIDEDVGEPSGGKKGKRRLLVVIGGALLLIIGGIAAAYFTGALDPIVELITGKSEEEEVLPAEAAASEDSVFLELQEILVNLNTGGRKSTFLKIRVSLELEAASDVKRIEAVMPRVVDNFQTYLRELRIEDLRGSAGMFRLREELLSRVNAAVAPAKVKDVLFKEMLVQ